MSMTRIDVITTGGTISSMPNSQNGAAPTLSGASLLAGIDAGPLDLRFVERPPRPSSWLSILEALEIARQIDASAADGADAVLVVQGTDTQEETSFVLELARKSNLPVAVTGSMRTPAHVGPDGQANISAALSYLRAAAPGSTAVVSNDQVHPSAHVRKAHTVLPSAFESAPFGPLGILVESEYLRYREPQPIDRSQLEGLDGKPGNILLVTAALGDDLEWLDSVIDRFDGVVYDAFGAGHASQRGGRILAEIAGRKPVVITSRTGALPMPARTYDYEGSESYFREAGALLSRGLDALRARILLALTARGDLEERRLRYREVEQLIVPEFGVS